jgi:hypothetical protein
MCIADISTVVVTLHYASATHEPPTATGPVSHHLLTPVFCHTDWDHIPVLHHLIQMQEFTNNSVSSQHKQKYPPPC